MELAGKVALVTGAGSGIGRASSRAMAREGARVLVVDVDEADGAETVSLIREAGGEAEFFRADVSSEQDAVGMVSEAEARFGGLDVVHNNAGLLYPGGFAGQPIEPYLRMIEVNFIGVVLGTHAAIPALQRRGGGVIVQTASIAGLIAYPGSPVYAATKAAVVSFTRGLGSLASENIRVNCICPEVVETPPILRARERARAAGISTPHMALPVIAVSEVAAGVLELIRDDRLAGCAMKISFGVPRELLEFSNWGVIRA